MRESRLKNSVAIGLVFGVTLMPLRQTSAAEQAVSSDGAVGRIVNVPPKALSGTFSFPRMDPSGNPEKVIINFESEFGDTPVISFSPSIAECPTFPLSRYYPNIWPHVVAAEVTGTGFVAEVPGDCPMYWGFNNSFTWTAQGALVQSGTVVPQYMVESVIYAPPGSKASHTNNMVTYAAGSTVGTLTSASKTFKTGVSVSVDVSAAAGGTAQLGGKFSASKSATTKEAFEVQLTSTASEELPGPPSDGINHDFDEIILLLNPSMKFEAGAAWVRWLPDNSIPTEIRLFVGELNGHFQMDPGHTAMLQNAGVTPPEYLKIMARDPLAVANPTYSLPRYQLQRVIDLVPAPTADAMPTTFSDTITNTTKNSTSNEATDEYSVQISASGGANVGVLAVKLNETMTWDWKHTSSITQSNGTTDSAHLTVSGPSYGNPQHVPAELEIYFDTVYRTFAFNLVDPGTNPVALSGTVSNPDGTPIANHQVVLMENGVTHSTRADVLGHYQFFGKFTGPATLKSNDRSVDIPAIEQTKTLDLLR
jgi:hypothetical protein